MGSEMCIRARSGVCTVTGMPQSCWYRWQAAWSGMGCPFSPSHAAARAVMCRTPSSTSGFSRSVRCSPVDVPAPSSSSSSGDEETFSCVGSPQRSSSFCPVGAAKPIVRSRSPATTGVRGRCVCRAPSSTVRNSSGTASRVSRWALDSTTTIAVSFPSASCSTSTSEGSSSPRATVVTVAGTARPAASSPAGAYRRIAPLYVSAISTEPSGRAVTPSACCRRARSASPSTWPKSNRPAPTAVPTSRRPSSPVRTQRTAEVSESATHSVPSAPTDSPEGCANQARPASPSSRPSSAVPACTASASVTGSKSKSWCVPAIAITTRPRAGCHTTSHGEDSEIAVGSPGRSARSTATSPSSSTAAASLARSESMSFCTPLPARVLTCPSDRRRPRSRWLTESATTTS
ncbi:hypothetical protein BW35_01544 [Micrococcus luteus]|nr:hypothetical protein BW35_01544 [Micrococcus luteus]